MNRKVLYIDITNLMHVEFLSGIQRVVREIILELIKKNEFRMILMVSCGSGRFSILTTEDFVRIFGNGSHSEKDRQIEFAEEIGLDGFENGAVFLELDSAWHNMESRTGLLAAMKARGVRIVLSLYDLIPIMYPQYVHERTGVLFNKFLAAHLKYDDLILTSTEAAIGYVEQLCRDLDIPCIPAKAAPLGCRASGTPYEPKIPADKTILMVGTIEPRKNHTLVLDAFDHTLFERGYKLVLVGNQGWNSEALEQRLKTHPMLGTQLRVLRGISDMELERLYRESLFLAFPSFAEGFGLPVLEAIGRGLPVLASDYEVIREVGKDYCRYFAPTDEAEFIRLVEYYSAHEEEYLAWKEHLAAYVPFTWSESADCFTAHLREEMNRDRGAHWRQGGLQATEKDAVGTGDGLQPLKENGLTQMHQLVVLSARINDLEKTIPYWELYLPFIEELVVCCPPDMAKQLETRKKGRFSITVLDDTEILGGEALPQDHQLRNFFLRAKLIGNDKIAPVFLMTDDDYRPLREISCDIYQKDGRYQAYYYYMSNEWHGQQGNPTSFDEGVVRTTEFLQTSGYPTYLCSSHMPQIIDRELFLEMLNCHPELLSIGPCEWTSYFNYVGAKYPDKICFRPYVTMNWPGNTVDWDLYCVPAEYLFENYYEYLYEDGRIFGGIDAEYPISLSGDEAKKVLAERNSEKLRRVTEAVSRQEHGRREYAMFCAKYQKEYGQQPDFVLYRSQEELHILVPAYIELLAGACIRITVLLVGVNESCSIQTCFISEKGGVGVVRTNSGSAGDDGIEVALIAPVREGNYHLSLEGSMGSIKCVCELPCTVKSE